MKFYVLDVFSEAIFSVMEKKRSQIHTALFMVHKGLNIRFARYEGNTKNMENTQDFYFLKSSLWRSLRRSMWSLKNGNKNKGR